MSQEKNDGTSALDKIKALKEQKELELINKENAQKLLEEKEESERQEQLQKQKNEIAKMLSRKEELIKRLEEVKSNISGIKKTAKDAIKEAGGREAFKSLLKETGNTLSTIFSGEKVEWHNLRNDVDSINNELKDLEIKIPEKEKEAEELFNQTKEGKQILKEKEEKENHTKQEKLAEEFVNLNNVDIKSLKNGEISFNMLRNTDKLIKKYETDRQEAISAIKYVASNRVKELFDKESKDSGLDKIKTDIEMIEQYHKDSQEVKKEIDNTLSYLEKLPEQYKELLSNNEEARRIISGYGLNPKNFEEVIYHGEHAKYRLPADKLKGISESFNNISIEKNAYNLDKIKSCLSQLREYNEGLISALKDNNINDINKKFFPHHGAFVYNDLILYNSLEKESISNKFKIPQFFEKKDYKQAKEEYEKSVSLQERTKISTLKLLDSSVDYIIANETLRKLDVSGYSSVDSLEREKATIIKQKEVASSISFNIDSYKVGHGELLSEKIDIGYPRPINLLDQHSKWQRQNEAIQIADKDINNKSRELKDLENKKLGVFDSKSKHQAKIEEIKDEINRIKNNKDNLLQEARRLDSDILAITPLLDILEKELLNYGEKIHLFLENKVGIKKGMTLGEALDKLTEYLNGLKEKTFSEEKEQALSNFKQAREKVEEAKKEIIAINKE